MDGVCRRGCLGRLFWLPRAGCLHNRGKDRRKEECRNVKDEEKELGGEEEINSFPWRLPGGAALPR